VTSTTPALDRLAERFYAFFDGPVDKELPPGEVRDDLVSADSQIAPMMTGDRAYTHFESVLEDTDSSENLGDDGQLASLVQALGEGLALWNPPYALPERASDFMDPLEVNAIGDNLDQSLNVAPGRSVVVQLLMPLIIRRAVEFHPEIGELAVSRYRLDDEMQAEQDASRQP
jgi:hypothetical protein